MADLINEMRSYRLPKDLAPVPNRQQVLVAGRRALVTE